MAGKTTDTVISMAEFNASAAAMGQSAEAPVSPAGPIDLETLDAPEPARGEVVIGTVTQEEAALYVALLTAVEMHDALEAECAADELTTAAEVIRRNGGRAADDNRLAALREQVESDGLLDRAARMERLFSLARTRDHYSASLFHSVCQRLGHADYVLAIRSKGRVVAGRRKW